MTFGCIEGSLSFFTLTLEIFVVICTGDTLSTLVLHLNCTALSQSESSNFFMFIVMGKIVIRHFQIYHHSIFCPSKILHKLFFQFVYCPKRNESGLWR